MSSKDGLLVAEPLSNSTCDPQTQNFTNLKDEVVSVFGLNWETRNDIRCRVADLHTILKPRLPGCAQLVRAIC